MIKHKIHKVYLSKSSVEFGLGLAFMLIGFVGAVSAGWIVAKPNIPVVTSKKVEPVQASCLEILKNLGYKVSLKENEIQATDDIPAPYFSQVVNASFAIDSCPGYTLQTYCTGPKCKEGKTTFVLKEQNKE